MEPQNRHLSDKPVPLMLNWKIIEGGRKYKLQANDSKGKYLVEINRTIRQTNSTRPYIHNITNIDVGVPEYYAPKIKRCMPRITLRIISYGKRAKEIVPNKPDEYLNGHWLSLLAERMVEIVSCIDKDNYRAHNLVVELSHGKDDSLDKEFSENLDALRFAKKVASRTQPGHVGITSALLSMLEMNTTYPSTDAFVKEVENAGLTELTSASSQNSNKNDYIFLSPESVFWSLLIKPEVCFNTRHKFNTQSTFNSKREVNPSTISFLREVLQKHPKTMKLLDDLKNDPSYSKYSFITKLPVDIIDNESLKRSVSRFVNRDTKYLTNMNRMMYVENQEIKSVCLLVTIQALCYQFKISDPAVKKHEDTANEIITPLMSLKPNEQDVLRLRRCLSIILTITEALDNHLGTSMFDQVVRGTRRTILKNIVLTKKEIPNYSKNDNLSVEVNHHLFVFMVDMVSTLVVTICESAGISASSTSKYTTEDLDDFKDLKNLYNSLAPIVPVIQAVMKI